MNLMKKSAVTLNILLGFVLIIAVLLFLPRAAGFQTYTVLSSSMEPTLPVGSVIYVRPYEDEDVKEQDIIAFQAGGILVAHRAISVDRSDRTVVTMGDANSVPDEVPTAFSDMVGKVCFYIPWLGYPLMMLQSAEGRMWLGAAALLLLFLPAGKKRKTEEKTHETNETHI